MPIAAIVGGFAELGHGSLAQRLAFALRRAIDAGLLPGGTTLPPERRLAEQLAVSRSTVTAALDLLRADGLLESRQGRGTSVVGQDAQGALHSNRMADYLVAGSGGIDLAVGNPADVSHLPPVSVDVGALLTSGAGPGFHPVGLPLLRQAIADGYADVGLHTGIDEIHVTSGAHQAVALLVGALVGPRRSVAVESPGYPGMFDILEGCGARVVPLRSDAGGVVPESLDAALGAGGADVVYLQSGPHNPTGIVTGPARLRALATVLDHHEANVIEDATLAELVFAGRPATDLARLCRRATVASVGSFSKVLWAGLRVGWLRAPIPIVDRTMHLRLAADLGPSAPAQVLCLALLPRLAEITDARRAFLASSVERGAELLAGEVPEFHVDPPAGGSVLWTRTPLDDTLPLVRLAHRHGVHVAPGSMAVEGRRPDPHLRICVDRPWPLVEAGLLRLASAWRELSRRPARIAG